MRLGGPEGPKAQNVVAIWYASSMVYVDIHSVTQTNESSVLVEAFSRFAIMGMGRLGPRRDLFMSSRVR